MMLFVKKLRPVSLSFTFYGRYFFSKSGAKLRKIRHISKNSNLYSKRLSVLRRFYYVKLNQLLISNLSIKH